MFENVATIVSAKSGGLPENQAERLLKSLGIERLKVETLELGRAADFFFSGSHQDLHARARGALGELAGCDIFVQPNDSFRRKKLFFADMDATMVVGETLDEMAAQCGLKDKVEPITVRAMRGDIDFAEALRQRVAMLKGMTEEQLSETIAGVRYSAGAKTLVQTLRRDKVKCVLISGGFDIFTSRVAAGLGFHENFGNRLGMHDGRLTGEIVPPVVDKNFKKRALEEERAKLGIDPCLTMAVGDGANDIPMLQTAGAGVGYFGKPAVQAATPHQIRYSDLTALLYMQGYRRAEFSA